jgi:hypothetical protein
MGLMRLASAILALALLLAACDDDADDGRTAKSPPNATMVAGPATSPSAPTTGMAASTPDAVTPEVTAIGTAVVMRDVARVAALIRYTPLLCTPEPIGIGAPPLCSAAGVPRGTTIKTLPFLGCEGEYLIEPRAADFIVAQAERLGARSGFVFRPSRHPFAVPSEGRQWPRPDYTIVFKGDGRTNLDLGIHVLDGRIIALQSFGICGGTLPAPDDPVWVTPPPR